MEKKRERSRVERRRGERGAKQSGGNEHRVFDRSIVHPQTHTHTSTERRRRAKKSLLLSSSDVASSSPSSIHLSFQKKREEGRIRCARVLGATATTIIIKS